MKYFKYRSFGKVYTKMFGRVPSKECKGEFFQAERGVITLEGQTTRNSRFCMAYAVWCALHRQGRKVLFLGQDREVSVLNEAIQFLYEGGQKLKGSLTAKPYVTERILGLDVDVLVIESNRIPYHEYEEIWYNAKKIVRIF